MDDCSGIDRHTIALSGLEANVVGGRDCRFIQTVAETANHTVYPQPAISPEHYFKKNLSLKVQFSCFLAVDGSRLVEDLDWLGGKGHALQIAPSGIAGDLLGRKTRLLNVTLGVLRTALPGLRKAVAESGTGDCPPASSRPTSTITGSKTFGQVERSQLGCR